MESYLHHSRLVSVWGIVLIVIPDAILNNPGKLTPEEFEVMKTHAAAGGKIVYEIIGGVEEKNYVDIVSDIASCHHEK